MTADPKICIVGAAGFVGAALARHPGAVAITRQEVDLQADGASLARLVDGQTVIFAASAVPVPEVDDAAYRANLAMLTPLLSAAPRHVCYLSTDAVYPFDVTVTEGTNPAPATAYAAMHLARENILLDHFAGRLLILRMSQIYGAADTHNAYGPMRMLRQAIAGGPLQIFGQGEERRDHLYVDDATEAILALTRTGHTGVLNLASGTSMTFADVARHVTREVPAEIEALPRRQAICHRDIDLSALCDALPDYTPRTLADGLKETIKGVSSHE